MSLKPTLKPQQTTFGSGPCAKFPGWSLAKLKDTAVSRSHRSQLGQQKITEALSLTREILRIPADYHLAIVPGSTTGAMEMAIWNLVGVKRLEIAIQDVFSNRWAQDILTQLKLSDVVCHLAPHGQLSDPSQINCDHDVLLNWNGSTSGVKFPHANWISRDRKGLIICDITSAVFTMELPWEKFDVAAFSWQKGVGGEAGLGMLVISTQAVARINSYVPTWPLPYLFKLRANGHFDADLFAGKTLNTPSLLCIEDYLIALHWARGLGGLPALIKRSHNNFALIEQWVDKTTWIDFMAEDVQTRSNSSICLKMTDARLNALTQEKQWQFLLHLVTLLEHEEVAFDILNHTSAPPSLRIWGGPTIEEADIKALLPWLEWGYAQTLQEFPL